MGKSFRRDNEYGRKFKGFRKNSDRNVKKQKYNSQPADSARNDGWEPATRWENWIKWFDFL